MALLTTRRSLLLGAGAFGAAAGLGLSSGPLRAQDGPRRGGTFRLAIADFNTGDNLQPQLNETRFMMNLNYALRNNLIEVGPGGRLEPELATEWDSNADSTVWTFKLRQGVEFHNGKTMTAEDVVWSINLHRGENTTSHAKSLLLPITDVAASAPDEVTITLNAPNAGFPSLLTLLQVLIVPAEDTNFDAGIGTGGYILESFEPGVSARGRRNPNYWKEGRAHFDEIELRAIRDVSARMTALQTGQIDAMNYVDATTANLLKALPNVQLIQTQGKLHFAFSVKCNEGPFTDPDVRRAMKLAIDRQEIVDKVLSGFGSIANDQPISTAYQYHNPNLPQTMYDPEEARALLRKAGVEGATVQLHVSETPFTGAVDAAQLYREHAARAGLNIEVTREPEDGYWSNIWGKRPFFASRWSGRVNEDAMLSLAYSRQSIGTWNETAWDNEAFNLALVAARGEKDETRRRELYWECQSLIHADGGMIAPVWADFLDAASSRIGHGDLASDWELDGARAAERWWFTS